MFFQEFKDAQSSSLDISASVEGGWGGYGGKFGYKDSSSSKQAKEFFQSGEGVMMVSTAECLLHKLRLNRYLMPDFTNQFIKALKALEGIKKSDHLSVRQNAYYKFYKEYGTHFFVETRFGGKLVIQTEYSKTEVRINLKT